MGMLDEIATFLAAASLGTVGTDIFKDLMPDDNLTLDGVVLGDKMMAILTYPGAEPDNTFATALPPVTHPKFQILCRDVPQDYTAAQVRCMGAWVALVAVSNQSLSGTMYYSIDALDNPFLLKRDENQRVYIASNFIATKVAS